MQPIPAEFCAEHEYLFIECEKHEIEVRARLNDLDKWNRLYRQHVEAAKQEGGPSQTGESIVKKAFVASFLRDNPKPTVPSLDTAHERRFHEMNELLAKHRLGIETIQPKQKAQAR